MTSPGGGGHEEEVSLAGDVGAIPTDHVNEAPIGSQVNASDVVASADDASQERTSPDNGSKHSQKETSGTVRSNDTMESISTPSHDTNSKSEDDVPADRSIDNQKRVKDMLSKEQRSKPSNPLKWKLVLVENGVRIFQRNSHHHRTNSMLSLLSSKTVASRLLRGLKNIFDEILFLAPPPPPIFARSSFGIEMLNPSQPLSFSPLPCYKSFTTINADAETVFQILLDYGCLRSEWDINFEQCEILNNFESNVTTNDSTKLSDFLHLTLKRPGVYNASKRDLALYREWWRDSSDCTERGDSYVIVQRSTRSLCIPNNLPGIVRAYIAGWAFVVTPLYDMLQEGGGEHARGKCVVMQLLEMNPGGWIHLLPDEMGRYAFDVRKKGSCSHA